MNPSLSAMLIRHEGMRLKAYLCPAGKITIGVGRNLEDNGITEKEALTLLEDDVQSVRAEAMASFPWFNTLSDVRQDVIISMIFNMGLDRFRGFKRLILALQRKDWDMAKNEMLSSSWAAEVKGRAVELAEMMRTGEYAG